MAKGGLVFGTNVGSASTATQLTTTATKVNGVLIYPLAANTSTSYVGAASPTLSAVNGFALPAAGVEFRATDGYNPIDLSDFYFLALVNSEGVGYIAWR